MLIEYRCPAHFNKHTFKELVEANFEVGSYNPVLVKTFNELASVQPAASAINMNIFFDACKNLKATEQDVHGFLQYLALGELSESIFDSNPVIAETVNRIRVAFTYRREDQSFREELVSTFHNQVNTVFATHVKAWQTQVNRIQKLDTTIFNLRKDIIPLDKIEKEIADAERKNREKDLAKALRRKEHTEAQLAEVAQLENEKQLENLVFADVQQKMIPVRKMEHVVRHLPKDQDIFSLDVLLNYAKACLTMNPAKFDDVLRYAGGVMVIS